jgi:hypothetical protein
MMVHFRYPLECLSSSENLRINENQDEYIRERVIYILESKQPLQENPIKSELSMPTNMTDSTIDQLVTTTTDIGVEEKDNSDSEAKDDQQQYDVQQPSSTTTTEPLFSPGDIYRILCPLNKVPMMHPGAAAAAWSTMEVEIENQTLRQEVQLLKTQLKDIKLTLETLPERLLNLQ